MDVITGQDALSRRPLSICLINPKFDPSFWGYDFALPLMPGDKRCWVVSGALPALAALAPPFCAVELLDENVEPILFEALERFDVIGLTGMIVQGERMQQILRELKRLPATVVIGGPYVSVAEELFDGLCDVRFIGEADETWPAFLEAFAANQPIQPRYQQAEKTNMRTVPPPRYDLVKADHYLMASLQFSRGCPFTCEFCDIITLFGRRPRLKAVDQMLEEFESVRRAGFRMCFLVDDNLIGNKKEAKKLLIALASWQERNAYPLQLFAEASINLSEDPEFIELMIRANVRQVFVGIESPRKASLAETKKIQNVRGESMLSRIQAIRDGGLVVVAGFMVGFDNDDETIFHDQFEFIREAGLANALVAILSPIPTTPLYDRLATAGRLDFDDPEVAFVPAMISKEALKAGYDELMKRLYAPEAYFDRLFAGYRGSPAFRARRRAMDEQIRGRPGALLAIKQTAGALLQACKLWRTLSRRNCGRRLGGAYVRAWSRLNLPLGKDRLPLPTFVGICVVHWHFFNIANRPRRGGEFGMVFQKTMPRLAEQVPVQATAA